MKENTIFNKDNFSIIEGNIFDLGTKNDVLVVPARRQPKAGEGLDKIVYELAGKKMASARIETLDIAELEVTDAFELKSYRKIYHVVPPTNYDEMNFACDLLEQCYFNCICEAVNNNESSIVFPLIGSRIMGFNMFDSYITAKKAIIKAVEEYNAHDLDIKLVIYGEMAEIAYQIEESGIDDTSAKNTDKKGSFFIYNAAGEYVMRYEDMRALYKEKNLSYFICQQITREKKAYLEEEGHSENGFAVKEISKVVNRWLNDLIKTDPGIRERKEAIEKLEELCGYYVSYKTIENIVKASKYVSDDEKKKYSVPCRHTKVVLALAMQLSREERIRFIMLGEEGRRYPDNREEEMIEIAKEHGNNNIMKIEKNVKNELYMPDYKLDKKHFGCSVKIPAKRPKADKSSRNTDHRR